MRGMKSPLYSSLLLLATASLGAQQPGAAPAQPTTPLPNVGDMAPDFAIRGATRYGLLQPTKLSDFKGQTVVLAFYVRVRTRG